MSQYAVGQVDVTNGSDTITGHGTAWLANVLPALAQQGAIFSVRGELAVYAVTAVPGDGTLKIIPAYAGSTKALQYYNVTYGFSPNYNFYLPSQRDYDFGYLLSLTIAKIDVVLGDILQMVGVHVGTDSPTDERAKVWFIPGAGGGGTTPTDVTPTAFTFTDQSGVALNTIIESNQITVAGINAAVAISISGGEYSKNGGTYTSTAGTVVNGDTVKVRHTSSSLNTSAVSTTLTIGGVSDTFTTTTVAAGDSTPTAFTFVDQTGVNSSTAIESNTITVAGINVATSISVTGGEYSKNGGTYTASAGTVVVGDTVKVRQTSSASGGVATNCVLTIGGVSDTFTVTTNTDSTPNAFTFVDQTGAAVNTVTESAPITVSGINSAAVISVSGGEYSKNGGAYTATTGTVANGDTVKVRVTSSSSSSTAVSAILTIGGVSDTFTVTTIGASNQAPTAPSSLSAGTYLADGTGCTLSWVASTDSDGTIASYKIYKDGVLVTTSTTTSKAITGQSAGSSGSWTVSAVDDLGLEGAQSEALLVQLIAAPPVALATAGEAQNIIALASGGTGATSFDIWWGTVAGTRTNQIVGVTLPYTHAGRTPGTAYYYSIMAVNASGHSESAEVSATPLAAPIYSTTFDDLTGWTAPAPGLSGALPTISGGRAVFADGSSNNGIRSFAATSSLTVEWVSKFNSVAGGYDMRIYLETPASTSFNNNAYLVLVGNGVYRASKYVNGAGTNADATLTAPDTNDHTYKMVVDTAAGTVKLYDNGVLKTTLTGGTHTSFDRIVIFSGAGNNSMESLKIY